MKTLAVITARGGSKRIPKKNIKNFMGRPMISYAIQAARDAGIFDVIMVSTDSEEIAKVAIAEGAEVPFMRSSKTSDDYATTYDVLEEVLNNYKKQGMEFDIIGCVYPCVPFLKAGTIRRAYEILSEENVTSVQPVCQYPVPIEWAMKLDNGYLIPNDKEALSIRSQDIEGKYFDVGMFYMCKVSDMLFEKTLVTRKTKGIIIEESECQDIDTIEDWKNAEIKYRILKEI